RAVLDRPVDEQTVPRNLAHRSTRCETHNNVRTQVEWILGFGVSTHEEPGRRLRVVAERQAGTSAGSGIYTGAGSGSGTTSGTGTSSGSTSRILFGSPISIGHPSYFRA